MSDSSLSGYSETSYTATSESAAGLRLHSLDGLRGWAALAVVIHHLVLFPLRSFVPETGSVIPQALANGQLAVMIFFVMSGIALTLPFWKKPYVDTVERLLYARYIRLTLPIIFACIAANIAVGLFDNSVPNAAKLLDSAEYAKFHQGFQSWTDIAVYSTFYVYESPFHNTPIAFLWTMRTEMAGSIAIFVFLLMTRKFGRAMLIAIISFLVLFLMNMFMACFFAGAFLGYLHHNGIFKRMESDHRWSAFSPILVVSTMLILQLLRINGAATLQVNMIAAALIVAVSISSRSIGNFLTTKPSRFLGKVSFPLYLTHYIFLVTFLPRTIIALESDAMLNKMTAISASLVSVILALILAACSTPIERLSVSLGRQFAIAMIRMRKATGIGAVRRASGRAT